MKRMKKMTKITLAASAAASAFVMPNPVAAASEQNTGDLVNQALKSAAALKSIYGSEDQKITAEFLNKYNAAKKEKLNAEEAIKKVSGAAKKDYLNKLALADQHLIRSARAIDANKAIKALKIEQDALIKWIQEEKMDLASVTSYNRLSQAIRKTEGIIGKVYGSKIRKKLLDEYITPSKIVKETMLYEVSTFNLQGEINDFLAKGDKVKAKDSYEKLERLMKRAEQIKQEGNKLYPGKYQALNKIKEQLQNEANKIKAIIETESPNGGTTGGGTGSGSTGGGTTGGGSNGGGTTGGGTTVTPPSAGESKPADAKDITEAVIGKTNIGTFAISSKDAVIGSAKANEVTTIDGDLYIDYQNAEPGEKIVLQNIVITGTLHTNFGEGDVQLKNVTSANVKVTNVGSHSIYITGNSSIGLLTITDTNNNAHIVVDDNANVANTTVFSGANLEVAAGAKNANPFANITVAPESNEEVILAGIFDNITISKPAVVSLGENTVVKNQMKIESAAELKASSTANIGKLEIKPANAEDKIVLSGNLSNVNVASSAKVELKSGNIEIAAEEGAKVDLNVAAGASAAVGTGTITNSGQGKLEEKTELSEEADVKHSTVTNFFTDNKVFDIPALISVKDLMSSIRVSAFAKMSVIDYQGNIVSPAEKLTESMQLKVVSESGKTVKLYGLDFVHNNGRSDLNYDFSFGDYDWEHRFEGDMNTKAGVYSGTFSFNMNPDKEEMVEGYYVSILGSKITAFTNDKQEKRKYITDEVIYQKFVPKSSANKGSYAAELKDIDLKGYTELSVSVKFAASGKIHGDHRMDIYDNPVNSTPPSTEGISISDFTDVNVEKGKIEGTVSFTKAADESNISYYDVRISKDYEPTADSRYGVSSSVGILEPVDGVNGVYTIETDSVIPAGLTKRLYISVVPVSKQGIRNYEDAEKIIIDVPGDQVLQLTTPTLFTDPVQNNALSASNLIEGGLLDIYKLNTTTNQYETVKTGYRSYGDQISEITDLEVGTYKVKQVYGNQDSEFSNAVAVKPMKLSGVLQNGNLSLVNALEGAKIKVYSSAGQVVQEQTVEKGKVPVIEKLENGTFYVTQSINGIESNKLVVPVNTQYTIEDIKQSILSSFNKGNVTAKLNDQGDIVLSKKGNGAVGTISFDTGANLDLRIGGLDYKVLQQITGTYNYSNATALEVKVQEDYETFLTKLTSENKTLYIGGNYDGEDFSFQILFDGITKN